MMRKRWLQGGALLIVAGALLAGCTLGGESREENPVTPANSGVSAVKTPDNELFIFTVWPAEYVKTDIFDRQVRQFVKQKFPEIEIKHIAWDDGKRYEDLIAAGTIPDIIMDDTHLNVQRYIIDNDLHYDMRELMKKHNFDEGRLVKQTMDRMRSLSKEGEIYGLPFRVGNFILYYNIDVFDKFGAAYPKLGMTYDEAYELAKKLTRVDGEVTYKGYSQNPGHYMNYNQLSLHPLHQSEDRASMTSDGWVKLVNNLRRFYEIPANQFNTVQNFYMGNIAMAVAGTGGIIDYYERNPNLNFNISSVPVFADQPEVVYQGNTNAMYITKQSQKKDMAFKVIDYLLSEEYSIEAAKEGIVPTVQTDAVKQAFGQNLPQMQGKNTEAVFYGRYADATPAREPGLTYILVPTQQAFDPFIFDESKDTVSALRLTEEAATKQILTKKAASEN